MRIVYIANHQRYQLNDDEGAITYALGRLGHNLLCPLEGTKIKHSMFASADFILFHKWWGIDYLDNLPDTCTRAYWTFDQVLSTDPNLRSRSIGESTRLEILNAKVDVAFCTDGDWVNYQTQLGASKTIWLQQGADNRTLGMGLPPQPVTNPTYPIFMPCKVHKCGIGRGEFVQTMKDYYSELYHVEYGIHGLDLHNVLQNTGMVIAPNAPFSNYYWSNRVYLLLGLGVFLLHPYCDNLAAQYEDGKEIVFYRSIEELHQLINKYKALPELRYEIAKAGVERTKEEHTYLNRCQQMINIINFYKGNRTNAD